MIVKRCDRCGAIGKASLLGLRGGWRSVWLARLYSTPDIWDLCPDCLEAFRAWVEMKPLTAEAGP